MMSLAPAQSRRHRLPPRTVRVTMRARQTRQLTLRGRTLDDHDSTAHRADRLRRALIAVAAGQAYGIDAILATEGPLLLGVARRILGRSDLAEEALQDAMLQVWRKAHQWDAAHGSARGWICAVLRNRCLNMLRDGKRLALMDPADLAVLQDNRQQVVPEEGWEILCAPTRLRDCLHTLDDASRHAILLAHVAGFTHDEIAARTTAPLGSVKSMIRRGLQRLKECLG
ncbi:RNA polymerase sigma-70 factor, ECF subfamily [Loktanella fryxellensis]|uniref:RNA polymerase sigma-70 factor, ECF subfamily n=1 Tax=Loktanella fryxellensis TaxID=245187 RepID=A0A1H8BRQ2_9RHOB|nr:sigma-70 family RNA polymerase sigma factor [Loktanella fryxellensis]SEM85550.1 RNA polymerase sigma-70 factor, ECF subfamily [Loktanella fryxellensis]